MGNTQSNDSLEQSQQPQTAENQTDSDEQQTSQNSNSDMDVSSTTPEKVDHVAEKHSATNEQSESPDAICHSSVVKEETLGRRKKFVAKVSDVFRRRKSKPTSEKPVGLKQRAEIDTQTAEDTKEGNNCDEKMAEQKSKLKSKKKPWFKLFAIPKWVIFSLMKILSWFIPKWVKTKIIAVKTVCKGTVKSLISMKMEVKIVILLLFIMVGMCLYVIVQNQQLVTTVLQEHAARSSEASEVNKRIKIVDKGVSTLNQKADVTNEKLDDVLENQKEEKRIKETIEDTPDYIPEDPTSLYVDMLGGVVNGSKAMVGKIQERGMYKIS